MIIVIFSSGDIEDLGQVDDKKRIMFVVIIGDLGQVDALSQLADRVRVGERNLIRFVFIRHQDLCQAYIGVDLRNSIWILFSTAVRRHCTDWYEI